MKKIVILVGSRRKKGYTVQFIQSIIEKLSMNNFEIEWLFPQDFNLKHCTGCHSCFLNAKCVLKDDLQILQEKILKSDVLIIASPVYLHYMTGDLKLILDRLSWWAHTLRLQGKPVVILSTCNSNGQKAVIEPLSKIINWMGGNVIATANASLIPDQLNNKIWLKSVASEINKRIIKFSNIPVQSNPFLEEVFEQGKQLMLYRKIHLQEKNIENGELQYWESTGMLNCKSYREHLEKMVKERKIS